MPATLPDVSTAKLPASYEAAKQALAECSRIDECQQWAIKAEALASYAKQSRDETLRKHADRIQARAIRRCGELLKQTETKQGARSDLGTVQTRGSAAKSAGLSERQRKTALRVANVSTKDFDEAIESADPPTVTVLAERGKLIDLGAAKPKDFARATQALAQLRRFAEFAAANDPAAVAAGVTPKEIKAARSHVAAIDSWLDRFITSLGA